MKAVMLVWAGKAHTLGGLLGRLSLGCGLMPHPPAVRRARRATLLEIAGQRDLPRPSRARVRDTPTSGRRVVVRQEPAYPNSSSWNPASG